MLTSNGSVGDQGLQQDSLLIWVSDTLTLTELWECLAFLLFRGFLIRLSQTQDKSSFLLIYREIFRLQVQRGISSVALVAISRITAPVHPWGSSTDQNTGWLSAEIRSCRNPQWLDCWVIMEIALSVEQPATISSQACSVFRSGPAYLIYLVAW